MNYHLYTFSRPLPVSRVPDVFTVEATQSLCFSQQSHDVIERLWCDT